MGFNFSFFGKQEVRKFNYRPRFYDPETEERRKKYGDFTKPKGNYVPGQHVKGSWRDGNYVNYFGTTFLNIVCGGADFGNSSRQNYGARAKIFCGAPIYTRRAK